MGAFSSCVSRMAFSGPLLVHGRRLRPLSFFVNMFKSGAMPNKGKPDSWEANITRAKKESCKGEIR